MSIEEIANQSNVEIEATHCKETVNNKLNDFIKHKTSEEVKSLFVEESSANQGALFKRVMMKSFMMLLIQEQPSSVSIITLNNFL